ncbi:MAG: hypothetical protein AAF249_17070 [Pseudomonadota bacterium]
MRIRIAVLSAALALGTASYAISPVFAQESGPVVAKDGSCPSGLKASGKYCIK